MLCINGVCFLAQSRKLKKERRRSAKAGPGTEPSQPATNEVAANQETGKAKQQASQPMKSIPSAKSTDSKKIPNASRGEEPAPKPSKTKSKPKPKSTSEPAAVVAKTTGKSKASQTKKKTAK